MAYIQDKTPPALQGAAGFVSGYLGTRNQLQNQEREFALEQQKIQSAYDFAKMRADSLAAKTQQATQAAQLKEQRDAVGQALNTLRLQGVKREDMLSGPNRTIWENADPKDQAQLLDAFEATEALEMKQGQVQEQIDRLTSAASAGLYSDEERDAAIEGLQGGVLDPEYAERDRRARIAEAAQGVSLANMRANVTDWARMQRDMIDPIQEPGVWRAADSMINAFELDESTAPEEFTKEFQQALANLRNPALPAYDRSDQPPSTWMESGPYANPTDTPKAAGKPAEAPSAPTDRPSLIQWGAASLKGSQDHAVAWREIAKEAKRLGIPRDSALKTAVEQALMEAPDNTVPPRITRPELGTH